MKTYLINKLQNISTLNHSLDLLSIIKASEWIIFNEDKDVIEKFLFVDNENILVSTNGKTSDIKWKYISMSESLLIDDDINKYLFKIIKYDKNIIVLNIDSTNKYSFLINSKSILKDATYEDIQWYLIRELGLDMLDDEQREIYLKEKELKEKQIKEMKRIERERNEMEAEEVKKALIVVTVVIIIFITVIYWFEYYY